MTPMGTFSQKIQCQPSVWVMSPPTIGPDATASPPMPPQMPMMVPRFSGGKAVIRMVRLKGMTMAAPMPCTTRAAMSCSGGGRQCARHGSAGENKEPNAEDATASEAVAQRRSGDDPRGEGEGEGIHGPLERRETGSEFAAHGWQSRDDHQHVEDDHEERH